MHLKTPEELAGQGGDDRGREHWLGAVNGKLFCLMLPGAKKCELCRFLAPFTVRIAGFVVGAWLLPSQLLTALRGSWFSFAAKAEQDFVKDGVDGGGMPGMGNRGDSAHCIRVLGKLFVPSGPYRGSNLR